MDTAPFSWNFFRPPLWHDWGEGFVRQTRCEGLPEPQWGLWNSTLAQELGLPEDPTQEAGAYFSGNGPQVPWCSAYAGHQFGQWAGLLGDGRAHTLGRIPAGNQEIQLKGAGMTPYSRRGDGRAVLRSSLREYLGSEAMAGLGIPTTRALALMTSPLPVRREMRETAAIVARVAPSFLRFGHVEHLAWHGFPAELKRLLDLLMAFHYPEARHQPNPVLSVLGEVVERTAHLMAAWQSVGFCHGVMNTDNMSLLGLTLDYGPFAFLDRFDPQFIGNHSDQEGRYAYDQQPWIGAWNCAVLGSALSALIDDEKGIQAVLGRYDTLFATSLLNRFRRKLGWQQALPGDPSLVDTLLSLLHQNRADFTRFFRFLSQDAVQAEPVRLEEEEEFQGPSPWTEWVRDYQERCVREEGSALARAQGMRATNPKYVLRTYLAELAIRQAQQGDFAMARNLESVLRTPCDEHPEFSAWALAPPDWAEALTLSCSS
ncbi:protein adenylyltransferase SelO [Ferrovum sp.]|uniref:protein adenylyltransferase SelO n=1 Tax=Ferrovum sp. TaxID=2609467 RepID=UPI0026290B55|nr:YdiU family protein [Ferrovum sp.]